MKNGSKRKTVVITGASAGVGRATARAFACEGARIGIIARDLERLEAVRQEIEDRGGEALILVCDVSDADQVELAAARVEEHFGPIDIWVNNAMISLFSAFKDMTSDEFRRVTEVTYLGVVYGTSAALGRMLPRNHGTIIQVGSALAERSIPLQSAYCGAKHAIRGFTDSIRCELIHDRSTVHITMVQLPAINTPRFDWTKSRMPLKPQPMPPVFQPEIAADAIVWSAKHRRREILVGMPTIKAVWGNKFFSGLLDHYLAFKGYSGQQTDELEQRDRPDNMWRPVQGDFGAHGRFDACARDKSEALWLVKNKWLGLGLLSVGVGAALATIVRGQLAEAKTDKVTIS